MKPARMFTRRRALAFVLVAAALLLTVSGTFANTRTEGGGDIPYYARIERGEIINDGEWAVIIFYRPPECVPAENFNLLDFYDFGAFDCTPPTTDGFILWSGEPWLSDPTMIKLKGLGAVPVWFVDWDEMQAAVADDVLTMPELEAQPSLMRGMADFYTETLQPAGAVNLPMITYVAQGSLEDGRSFFAHALLIVNKVWNVQIKFK